MATPNPDFQTNNRPQNPQTLGEFIRMKRVPRKGKKTNLGIKNLISRFENKLTTGEQVQGSVIAVPSAPSYTEDDSDCESWGSDFDEDENAEDLSWEPQEEIENSINDMLEAARERDRKLQNSGIGGSAAPQELPSRSDAHLPPEGLGFSADPNAPPLPPRNPVGISNASPIKRSRENRTSAGSSTPGRGISDTNVKPPSSSASKLAITQKKSPPQGITPPVLRFAAASVSSTSGTGNTTLTTPVGPSPSESQRQTTPQRVAPKFPPDVTNISSSSPTSPMLPLASSVITVAAGTTSASGDEASSKREASNLPNASQVENPQRARLIQELAEVSGQPKGSPAVPECPPLPSRPPPVRRLLNNPPIKNSPTHLGTPASASKAGNDAVMDQKITQQTVISPTVPQLPNSVAKLQVTKGESSSLTNLAESALQNSSSSESSKPIFITSEHLASRLVVRLPEKPDPKRKSIAFEVPKIIKELDTAVLKQVMPKKRNKSARIGEMEHGRSSSENSAKAEDAKSLPEEYLNPKEIAAATVSEKSEKVPEFPAVDDEVFRQPWYHPVTWAQAQFKLTTMAQDGAFLVRPSSRVSEGVPLTISVFFRGRVINCHISSTPERKYALGKLKPNQKTFDTITELIRYYQSTPAELKISEADPVSRVCLLITPPRDSDKIYVDI